MEKFKNFFYDKNDLVVALIIIIAAGLLIAWRVNIIMDYPQVMAAQIQQQGEQEAGSDGAEQPGGNGQDADGSGQNVGGDGQTPVTPTPGAAAADPGSTGTNGNGSANGAGSGSSDDDRGADNAKPDTNTGNITVTIPPGSTGDKIAQILLDAGAVSSKSDFTSAVAEAKADTKLKAGTFQIPAGSSPGDVVKIITKN